MSHTGYFQTKAHLQISGAALISGAITIISNWWKLRRATITLSQLSPEQLKDCGIGRPQRDLPVFEVPRGLISKITPSW